MNIKRLKDDNLVARFLALLARLVYRRRALFLWPQVVLFALSIWYTIENLKFSTVRSDLVGANKRYHQNYQKFKKEFPTQEDLVVVVESEDPEKNRQFVERLGARLLVETNLFTDIFYRPDLRMLGSKALLFVPEEDLAALRKRLVDYQPFLRQFTQATNLQSFISMMNAQFRNAVREKNAENDAMVKSLPAIGRILTQATDSVGRPGTPPSPGITALFSAGKEAAQQAYITFDNGRIYLVTAQAPRAELNYDSVRRLRQLVDQTKIEVPGLNVGITGEPILELDEMAQSKVDSTIATIVSLVVCALIFIYGFQETGRPVKATLCLVIGLAYTMGFATLAVGHLNILTITFLPILIGLAIDYGVHLISRYEEEVRHGRTDEEALQKAMVYTGQGIFTGAFTTAGAFLAMGFTDFKGIKEMGIICGGGLLICLIPMMTMLPVLLLRGRQNVIDHHEGDPGDRGHVADLRTRVEAFWLRHPWWVVGITVAITAWSAVHARKVYFDYNLLNMQSRGLPAVEFEHKLIESRSKSVLYAAIYTDDLEQARALEERIRKLPAVANVDSMANFMTEDQSRKLVMVGQIKADLANLRFAEPDPEPVDLLELSSTLYYFGGYMGMAADDTRQEDPELSRQLSDIRRTVTDLRREMLKGAPEEREVAARKLGKFQYALFSDIKETFDSLRTQDTSGPIRPENLPEALRNRFVGIHGKHLLMIYPKKDVWTRENQKEFIEQLRTIDENVTGTPVQLYEYTGLLKSSYEEAAGYSLIAITILVLIHFRSILPVILSLIPVGLGFLWLAGIMGYYDVALNPANIMTLPLVIGIGVTNGLHILNRYAEEQTPSILARSTGKAVLVSGLTSIAGFGSLMLAKHRGIQSLGFIMSIGLATCMIAGLAFLPALLNLLFRRAGHKNRPSADNAESGTGSGGTEVKTSM